MTTPASVLDSLTQTIENLAQQMTQVQFSHFQQMMHAHALNTGLGNDLNRALAEISRLTDGDSADLDPEPPEPEAKPRDKKLHPLYKTQLCMGFSKNGECRFGERCCFAHGENELRDTPAV